LKSRRAHNQFILLLRRNQQLQALQLSASAWNPDHHPELAQGGEAYVEQIRREPDERFENAIRGNQAD
jgi:hypothetical protein